MNKKLVMVIACIALISVIGIAYEHSGAVSNDPGTIADPLVTKSYVDVQNSALIADVEEMLADFEPSSETGEPTNMTDIYKYIDSKFAAIASNGVTIAEGFTVIEVQAGQQVICEESTEIIIRGGEATAIGNTAGDGLSDITAGKDIKNNETIANNHLLIVPRTDGRGVSVVKKSFIMIKGDYIIQ